MSNNSKIQIIIEEEVTDILVQNEPIVVEAWLAVPQIGAGNYLFSDQDAYKTDGFLRFQRTKELQFEETAISKFYGSNTGVYFDLGAADFKIRDNNTERFTFSRGTGDFTATGDVAAYSDERLKIEVEQIKEALNKVKKLRGVTFYKVTDLDRKATGVIAQEVQKVLPEAVKMDEEGFLTVAYGNMIGLLIEAIKELAGELENVRKSGCACSGTGCFTTEVKEP